METVYILQIVTISITAITLIINVLVTLMTNTQKNYNEIITTSRLEFLAHNRNNAAEFISEAKNIALLLKSGANPIDVKPLYLAFEQICIALKPYNAFDKEIIDVGKKITSLIEQSVLAGHLNESLGDAIGKFAHLFNIYDDADWKFIKQQFNSTHKNSDDFDKICADILLKYKD